ncbi:putative membrane protein YeaQ/YmgE (transglycosylase-associated protein family) [Thermocatellispora tengchongensis]|uniref:Putative membrane protein YeaQ/YmgE (Transglycosylase-associated protein family) n=1 Tax=Thermocatellispora tengchongensis TaxID=1073253 RepID=A0A840PI05_9ACTN|nr:GlsB/YeaQ/YmgE family stress response membrane protein [Thermocatellispora tengchongensis]MBB5138772.1 putative membrane protein YeaQ/YmgE (transglycosylase-associated protein family) [Thermocatellispora tengchongensis]
MIGTIIWAIVIGAVIGALARLIVPGRQNMSWALTLIVGIVAALIGTLIAQAFGVATTAGVDWIELLMQVVLAVIGVLIVTRVMAGRGRA